MHKEKLNIFLFFLLKTNHRHESSLEVILLKIQIVFSCVFLKKKIFFFRFFPFQYKNMKPNQSKKSVRKWQKNKLFNINTELWLRFSQWNRKNDEFKQMRVLIKKQKILALSCFILANSHSQSCEHIHGDASFNINGDKIYIRHSFPSLKLYSNLVCTNLYCWTFCSNVCVCVWEVFLKSWKFMSDEHFFFCKLFSLNECKFSF